MTVRTINNQYPGINAHLHSYFQSEGDWDGFHANHIADLMRLMSADLLSMGYVADIQQSLQIRRFGEPAGKPEADVTIFDTDRIRASRSSATATSPAQGLAIADVMDVREEFALYRAVAIYEYQTGKRDPGEPVAWIELLSPSNKPGGQDAIYYRDKRLKVLHSGIVFVELDYLHESPSTLDRIPRYNRGEQAEPGSHPYYIVVVDPRPTFAEGEAYPYGFDVDVAIPIVDIPLNAGDMFQFDFGRAYQKTYEETLYGTRFVDYEQLPLNFERYRADDRARIVARMLAILRAAREVADLERAPLPVESIDLERGLAELDTLRKAQHRDAEE